eukprot:273583-Amphidinium_carterae.1
MLWNLIHNSEDKDVIPPGKMTKPSMLHIGAVSMVTSASKCEPDKSGEVWPAKSLLASLVLGWVDQHCGSQRPHVLRTW